MSDKHACPMRPECDRWPCRHPGVDLWLDGDGCDRCALLNCPQLAADEGWRCPCRWAVDAAEAERGRAQMSLFGGE